MAATSLEHHLAAQAASPSTGRRLPVATGNNTLWEMVLDLTGSLVTQLLRQQCHSGNGVPISTILPNHMVAAMELTGDVTARFILSVSERQQKIIATSMLPEGSLENEPQEVIEDTVLELVNVICGNVVAEASRRGVTLDILPPYTVRVPSTGLPTPDLCDAFTVPLQLEDGETLELILLIER